jgi:hypothetical protein
MVEWSQALSHARAAVGPDCRYRPTHGGRGTFRPEPRPPTRTCSDELPTRCAPAAASSLATTTTLELLHLSPSPCTGNAGLVRAARGLGHRTNDPRTGPSSRSFETLVSSSAPITYHRIGGHWLAVDVSRGHERQHRQACSPWPSLQ